MPALHDGATDLRGATSLWQALAPSDGGPTRKPMAGEVLAADVCIIGAGITGSFLAERFTRMGKSVILIDRREPERGSTAASTAMLQWEIDAPLLELEDRLGFEAAKTIAVQCRNAVQEIGALTRDLGVDCGYRDLAAIYLSGDQLDANELKEEHKLRIRMGFEGVCLDRDGLAARGYEGDAGLLYPGSAEADPMALARGLLDAARARGALVLSPAIAVDYDWTRSGVEVAMAEGAFVKAGVLLLANGYEMPGFVPSTLHSITSSWAIASKPLAGRRAKHAVDTLVWEAADPYLYFRPAPGGRIVVGGEDEEIRDPKERDAMIGEKTKAIIAKLEARCPALKGLEAEFAWSGFFGETADSLPLIGRVPGYGRCYAAFGYGGNGITFSYMASRLVARMIAGEREAWYDDVAIDRAAP